MISYVSIFNRDTKTLNYTCEKDPTTSILKIEGPLDEVVINKAKFVVSDGVAIKNLAKNRFLNYSDNEIVDETTLANLEAAYLKTTTKHITNSQILVEILK